MRNSPLVTVIIANWNGEKILGRCLTALDKQTFKDFETILVDNASADQSLALVERTWPGVKLIKLDSNFGFALANNIGARSAKGEWIAFLNNDAFPQPEWLEALVRAAQSHPAYSSFASQIVKADNPMVVESAGDIYHISGYAWHRYKEGHIDLVPQEEVEVFSACAAASMVNKTDFIEVGGFDGIYFSHFEDVDLGFRLRLRGKRCLYVPDAIVLHLGSASFGVENDFTIYQVQRNLLWTYFKNMPKPLIWKNLPACLFANIVFLFHYSLRGKWKPIIRAQMDAVRGLNQVLRQRRQIQANVQVEAGDIDRLMEHNWLAPLLLGKRMKKIRGITHYWEKS